MAKSFHYFVSGRTAFPTDMLRYDRAKVVLAGTACGFRGYLIEADHQPTYGRWASFMWPVFLTKADPMGGWQVRCFEKWHSITDTSTANLPKRGA